MAGNHMTRPDLQARKSESTYQTRARNRLRHNFITRLVNMKDEAGRLGLYRTMHALDNATREVGYEMVDILEGKQHT